MADAATSGDVDPLYLLAEEFLDAYRRGERPTPSGYARRHPELAARILALFPALLEVEDAAPAPAAPPSLRGAAPDRIGEFTLLGTIGAGGMGESSTGPSRSRWAASSR